jgi:hypothetical protein
VAASADQIEMSGAAFVPICLNAHGSGPSGARWAFIQSAAAKTVPLGEGDLFLAGEGGHDAIEALTRAGVESPHTLGSN